MPHTLDSGINIALLINVAPGTFGKNNKDSLSKKHIPLHQITEFQTFFIYRLLSLIRTYPLENIPKVNKCIPMFILESRVFENHLNIELKTNIKYLSQQEQIYKACKHCKD